MSTEPIHSAPDNGGYPAAPTSIELQDHARRFSVATPERNSVDGPIGTLAAGDVPSLTRKSTYLLDSFIVFVRRVLCRLRFSRCLIDEESFYGSCRLKKLPPQILIHSTPTKMRVALWLVLQASQNQLHQQQQYLRASGDQGQPRPVLARGLSGYTRAHVASPLH